MLTKQAACSDTFDCLAYGTLVLMADGSERPIERIAIGDQILAAGLDLKFQPCKVIFSMGTGPHSRNRAFYIDFTIAGQGHSLICTEDHPLLVGNGLRQIKRVSKLKPGDILVDREGDACIINAVEVGETGLGIHCIGTSDRPTVNPNGHLFMANGVVSGDYNLQAGELSGASPDGPAS